MTLNLVTSPLPPRVPPNFDCSVHDRWHAQDRLHKICAVRVKLVVIQLQTQAYKSVYLHYCTVYQ